MKLVNYFLGLSLVFCIGAQELTTEMMYNLLSRRLDNIVFNLKTEIHLLNDKINGIEAKVNTLMDEKVTEEPDIALTAHQMALDEDAIKSIVWDKVKSLSNVVSKTLKSEKRILRNGLAQISEQVGIIKETKSLIDKKVGEFESGFTNTLQTVQADLGTLNASVANIHRDIDQRKAQQNKAVTILSDELKIVSMNLEDKEVIIEAFSQNIKSMRKDVNRLTNIRKSSFSARLMSNKYNVPKETVLVFDHIYRNEGSHYDRTTGIFTAPESGVYMFTFTMQAMQITGTPSLACLYVDAVQKTCTVSEIWHSNMDVMGTTSEVVHVKEGGRVWIQTLSTTKPSQNFFAYGTTFKGAFLYPSSA